MHYDTGSSWAMEKDDTSEIRQMTGKSLFCLSTENGCRAAFWKIATHKWFDNFILLLILISTLTRWVKMRSYQRETMSIVLEAILEQLSNQKQREKLTFAIKSRGTLHLLDQRYGDQKQQTMTIAAMTVMATRL